MMNATRGLLALVLICACLGSGIVTFASAADDPWEGDIVIKSDGSVTPSDAPMKISGKNYKLTSDIEGTITIEKEEVILNGDGYKMIGDGSGNAVYADGLEGITVRNMDIDNFVYAIYLNEVTDSKIMNNEISNVRAGLWMLYCDGNKIFENTIVDLRFGVYLWDCSENRITSNVIHGTTWDYTSQVVMGVGLRYGSNYNTINDNTIYDMYHDGVYIETECNYNIVKGNDISNCGEGGISIFLESMYNEIFENDFNECFFGVGLYYDNPSNTIRDNHFSGGYGGIGTYLSGECLFKGNHFIGVYDCINLAYSDSNIFRENVIESGVHAFWMEESYDNVLYHNDIIDYSYPFDTTSYFGNPGTSEADNVWDNGKGEGNYWSDYDGEDTDDDGIGDTDLPHAGVDYYPLMGPYN